MNTSEIKIFTVSLPKTQPDIYNSVRGIFFETSSKKIFTDEAQKEAFFRCWTDYYLSKNYSGSLLIAQQNNKILGYLMGCFNSQTAQVYFNSRIASYNLFANLFSKYPAHLHINLTPLSQGKGVGTKLLQHFFKTLIKNNINGVHIVTAPESKNINFYKKNGFNFTKVGQLKNSSPLFMGKLLN